MARIRVPDGMFVKLYGSIVGPEEQRVALCGASIIVSAIACGIGGGLRY